MKFKQSEVIEDYPNKVLFHKCQKLSATVTNIAKLSNIIANNCIEKLRAHTQADTHALTQATQEDIEECNLLQA